LLAKRRARTSDLVKQSEKARIRAAELQMFVDGTLREERKRISTWLEEEKKKVSDEERQILTRARSEAGKEMDAARLKIAEEVAEAKQKLAPMVQDYASQIATRLLGRKVVVSATASRSSAHESENRTTT
jgi:F0F1-type ATP synthase membrane subunit b/b'